jgi:uncharacterized protein YceH (UPF0502 family)
MNDEHSDTAGFPLLDTTEARILGSLVEKEATTPENYPLTANAVQLACNQKSGRDPEMALDAGAVGHALRALEGRRLVKSVHGARAQRYEHRFAETYSLTRVQQALLAVLLLRGAQTASELRERAERLAPVAGPDEVRDVLDRLRQRGLVVNVGHGPGQREDRWMHQLCGPVSAADLPAPRPATRDRDTDARDVDALASRIAALEAELSELRARLDRLGLD